MTKDAAPLIFEKMINIMQQIGSIGKDTKNTMQGFMFRGIDDVYNSLHKIMGKEGVFTTSKILDRSREERQSKSGGILTFTVLRIAYTFHASDGSSVTTESEGEAMDSGDKSTGKAMSIADKYALLQAFKIPTKEDKDPDLYTSPTTVPKVKGITEMKKTVAGFLRDFIETESVDEMDSICETYKDKIIKIRAEAPHLLTGNEETEGTLSVDDNFTKHRLKLKNKAVMAKKMQDDMSPPE